MKKIKQTIGNVLGMIAWIGLNILAVLAIILLLILLGILELLLIISFMISSITGNSVKSSHIIETGNETSILLMTMIKALFFGFIIVDDEKFDKLDTALEETMETYKHRRR